MKVIRTLMVDGYAHATPTIERSHTRDSRSHGHKTEMIDVKSTPRTANMVSAQVSALLNRIRLESRR